MRFRGMLLVAAPAVIALVSTGFLVSACGKKDAASDSKKASKDVTVSGKLALADSALHANLLGLETYEVYCVTFNVPPAAGSGMADSEGNFSLTLDNAKNSPFGCFIRKDGETVATMSFEDSANTGFDGESAKKGSISLSRSATFGTITLDLETGKAVVDMANVKTVGGKDALTEAEGGWDFTGTWQFRSLTGTDWAPYAAQGYSQLCTQAQQNSGNCNGPGEGQSVYFKRFYGKAFTPDATCAGKVANNTFSPSDTCRGTASATPMYGIMVWRSKEIYTACGGKLGIENETAKAYGGVDLSDSIAAGVIGDGFFAWDTSVTVGDNTYTLSGGTDEKGHWKITDATAMYSQWACKQGTGCWPSNNAPFIAENATCSQSTSGAGDYQNEADLAVLKCFANAYRESGLGDDGPSAPSTACVPKINTNWDASTPNDFIRQDGGPARANGEYVFEKFTYTSPKSGTLRFEERRYEGVKETVTDGDRTWDKWSNCEVLSTQSVNVTKLTETEMLFEFSSTYKLLDSREECVNGVELHDSKTVSKAVKISN